MIQVDEKDQLKKLAAAFGIKCLFLSRKDTELLASAFADILLVDADNLRQNLAQMEHSYEIGVLYHVVSLYEIHFIQFLMPHTSWTTDAPLFCSIGPFTMLPSSDLAEKVHPARDQEQDALKHFYNDIPVSMDYSVLKELILQEACYIMPDANVHYMELSLSGKRGDLHQTVLDHYRLDELSAKQVEQRYANEDAVLEAIREGDESRAMELMRNFSGSAYTRKGIDHLRRNKDAMLVWNTLCRKAVEEAMVLPVYIDRASSKFSERIEAVGNGSELLIIFQDMVHEYCVLAREQSVSSYSELIRNALLYINRNLSEPMNATSISEALHVTPNYLSSRFSEETGSTITSYLNGQRVQESLRYLMIPDLPIQDVAHRAGFSDANYYARIFRKYKNMSPQAYRKMVSQKAGKDKKRKNAQPVQ